MSGPDDVGSEKTLDLECLLSAGHGRSNSSCVKARDGDVCLTNWNNYLKR